ncbi:hypothetical protein ACHAWF_005020 [Thalassiosira exigua]
MRRPIVCYTGTFMNNLSCWLDYWLQKLKPFVSSYIHESHDFLAKLKQLGCIPRNVKLFTADAVSMYTNIDTGHAIVVIGSWLDNLEDSGRLSDDFPLDTVKEAMTLVMRNNLFEWGYCYFLQLLGTAMGTSVACMWATIYFAVWETRNLLPHYGRHLLPAQDRGPIVPYSQRLLFYKLPSMGTIKHNTSLFGILQWEFDELSSSTTFLDLTISIKNGAIVTKTHQKAMNRYQYIPPTSAHPSGMMKGIIYGLMRNDYLQNSKESDYMDMAVKLFGRHGTRGWNRTEMKGFILSADAKLRTQPLTVAAPEPLSNKEMLFLHLEYYPNDISKRKVRLLYGIYRKQISEDVLDINQTNVAYSRPKNTRELVIKAKLHQAPGREATVDGFAKHFASHAKDFQISNKIKNSKQRRPHTY